VSFLCDFLEPTALTKSCTKANIFHQVLNTWQK